MCECTRDVWETEGEVEGGERERRSRREKTKRKKKEKRRKKRDSVCEKKKE